VVGQFGEVEDFWKGDGGAWTWACIIILSDKSGEEHVQNPEMTSSYVRAELMKV
jgi:hypothetical protein